MTALTIWAASSSATAGSTRSSAPVRATAGPSCSSPRRKGRTSGPTASVPADVIAEPYRTIIHWHPDTEFREDPASCEALYQSVLQADAIRAQEKAKVDQERRERESRCEAFWKEHTPEWAKGYIVAELREAISDIMTDYIVHRVIKRVLLGFSKSDRNNFREMRKLAATFGPTEKLATEGQENRENYTGGSGYYLSGPYRRSGWLGDPQGEPQVRPASRQSGRSGFRPLAGDRFPLTITAPASAGAHKKEPDMNEILYIRMERDGLSRHEALEVMREAREAMLEALDMGLDPEEVFSDITGLEPDYIWSVL